MNNNIVYKKDILYPTENISEPGSIYIEMLGPTRMGRIPLIIENRTEHFLLDYLDAIVNVLQEDIFDRIHVNVKRNVSMYIKSAGIARKEFEGKKYLQIVFNDNKADCKAVDEVDE